MSTALQIVNLALKQIRVLHFGETASTDLRSDALEVFNQMLAEWSNTRLLVPYVTWGSFSMVSAQASYTIGPSGANVTATRPKDIDRVFVRVSSIDYLCVKLDEDGYMRRDIKTTAGRPSGFWYNPTTPSGTLYLYPVPDTTDTLYYSHVQAFGEPTLESDTLVIPRGYDSALTFNLAVRLTSMLGKPLDPFVVDQARKARDELIALNAVRRVKAAVLNILSAEEGESMGEGTGGGVTTVDGLIIE